MDVGLKPEHPAIREGDVFVATVQVFRDGHDQVACLHGTNPLSVLPYEFRRLEPNGPTHCPAAIRAFDREL